MAEQVGNVELPGVRNIIQRLSASSDTVSPEGFVDGCLDLIGPVQVTEKTRNSLIAHAKQAGPLSRDTEEQRSQFAKRVGEMLQMIAAAAEYQYT